MAKVQYTRQKSNSYAKPFLNTWLKLNIHGKCSINMSAFVKKYGIKIKFICQHFGKYIFETKYTWHKVVFT